MQARTFIPHGIGPEYALWPDGRQGDLLNDTPPEAPPGNDLRTVARELSQVRPALAAPAVKLPLKLTYHDSGHSLDRGSEWLAKPPGRDTRRIAVNADGSLVDVTFGGLSRFGHCESMIAPRAVAWLDGQFRALFDTRARLLPRPIRWGEGRGEGRVPLNTYG